MNDVLKTYQSKAARQTQQQQWTHVSAAAAHDGRADHMGQYFTLVLFGAFVVLLLLGLWIGTVAFRTITVMRDATDDARLALTSLQNRVRSFDQADSFGTGQGPEGPAIVFTYKLEAGDHETRLAYNDKAKKMAAQWAADAKEGEKGDAHYRLAFDRADTWSQKYNMVWDKLWGTEIFPKEAMPMEIAYYLKKQNQYGLPLDCRKDYTKSDWIMWTAAMSPDRKTLDKFIAPLYDYINETETRVPISDWYDTVTGRKTGFMARSVIGGHWMPLLADKLGH